MDNQNEKKPTLEEAFTPDRGDPHTDGTAGDFAGGIFFAVSAGGIAIKKLRNHSGRSGKKDADPR